MTRFVLAILLASSGADLSAQGFRGAGWLTSQAEVHDVRAAAMGRSGAFLPDASPLSFVQNPARLAEASVAPVLRVSVTGHPNYRDFFGGSLGVSTGHVAATRAVGPVALGAVASTQSRQETLTNELGESFGEVDTGDRTFAVGAALRLGAPRAHLDVGTTLRLTQLRGLFNSVDADGVLETQTSTRPSVDIGALATVHLFSRASSGATRNAVRPTAAVSAGYTQRAIGSAFEGDFLRNEAIQIEQPRTGVVGLAIQIGLDAPASRGDLRLVALDVAAEAESALNTFASDDASGGRPPVDRAVLIGAIQAQNAVLGTSRDETVEGQRGARLTVAETLWLALGRSEGPYGEFRSLQTGGLGVSLSGALRAVGALQEDEALVRLGNRYDLTLGISRATLRSSFESAETILSYRLFTVGGAARL